MSAHHTVLVWGSNFFGLAEESSFLFFGPLLVLSLRWGTSLAVRRHGVSRLKCTKAHLQPLDVVMSVEPRQFLPFSNSRWIEDALAQRLSKPNCLDGPWLFKHGRPPAGSMAMGRLGRPDSHAYSMRPSILIPADALEYIFIPIELREGVLRQSTMAPCSRTDPVLGRTMVPQALVTTERLENAGRYHHFPLS
jgi:hypothetical protein